MTFVITYTPPTPVSPTPVPAHNPQSITITLNTPYTDPSGSGQMCVDATISGVNNLANLGLTSNVITFYGPDAATVLDVASTALGSLFAQMPFASHFTSVVPAFMTISAWNAKYPATQWPTS